LTQVFLKKYCPLAAHWQPTGSPLAAHWPIKRWLNLFLNLIFICTMSRV
jgi:hypothetical protein